MKGSVTHDVIHQYVKDVRDFLLSSSKTDFREGTSLSVSQFPSGCCEDASTLLSLFLQEQGVDSFENYYGETPSGSSHVWLQFEDLIIDITRDQFSEGNNKIDLLIMSKADKWHRQLVNIENRGLATQEVLQSLSMRLNFAMIDALNKLRSHLQKTRLERSQ